MNDHRPSQAPGTSRRTFLKQAGLGATAASLLAQLTKVQQTFGDELGDFERTNVAALSSPSQYSLAPEVTYLNHASIGTIPQPVQKAHQRYLEICESNPWLHIWGDAWVEPLAAVRAKAAGLLGCGAQEVAITHNTTEAFNVLAHGIPLGKGDEVLFSSLNHSGASACWFHRAVESGFQVRRFDFPMLEGPRLNEERLLEIYDQQITSKTRVLVFPHVDNTLGIRHPMAELTALARAKGVRFIAVDGAQTAGMLPLNLATSGVDVYATSAHKWMQAPKGLGLTYLRSEIQDEMSPMWVTWGQKSFEGTVRIFEDYGTRNLPAVLAMGDAMSFQEQITPAAREEHHRQLWQDTQRAVEKHPRLRWRSPKDWQLGAALYAIEVEGSKTRKLAARLFEEHGFVVRPFETEELNTLRLSPNLSNTLADIEGLFALC